MSHLIDPTAARRWARFRSSALVLVLTAATVVASSTSASASDGGQRSNALRLQQRYWAWIAGSDTNPAFQDGFCGEQVGNAFFHSAAFAPGETVLDCTIPADMPIVLSPGGAVEWEDPNLQTDAAILAQRDIDVAAAQLANPTASLDGRDLHPERAFARSGVYRIPIAPNSLIKTVDPTVPADATSIRVASLGWTLQIHELHEGQHTIHLSDTIGGELFAVTFHITVSGH
jgi:hypothetical protein